MRRLPTSDRSNRLSRALDGPGGQFRETNGQRSDSGEERASSDQPSGVVKTGTTTVGAVGSDGVVLAADTRASLGGRFVTNQRMRKIAPVDDRIAVAFAGSVSDAQAFVRRLRTELRLYEMRHGSPASVETAATTAGDLVRRGPYRVLDLVLGGVDEDPSVYDIGQGGGVMQSDYAASGSGMQLAYGALEGAYEPDLPVSELATVVSEAVRNATERDTASGDGMTVATITDEALDLDAYDGVDSALASITDSESGSGAGSIGGEESNGEVA